MRGSAVRRFLKACLVRAFCHCFDFLFCYESGWAFKMVMAD